jgi:hypothetical protein
MLKRILILTAALTADIICWTVLFCLVTGCASANAPEQLVADGFYASVCEVNDSCIEPEELVAEAPVLGKKKKSRRK